jgi:hypothetical protein
MSRFQSAKGNTWLTAILISSFLTGCTPFFTKPDVNTADIKSGTEQAKTAVECPHPESKATAKIEPEPIWPTPVCPKVKPLKCPLCAAAVIANKPVLGEYETVLVDPPGIKYLARIDTGATSSSIHASKITRFERDGKKWVRFQIDKPSSQETVMLERKFVREVRIKQAENQGNNRVTVMMTLRIGDIVRQIEVSLTDRSNMEFPVLIGRNFLLDTALVDVSLRHTAN